MTRRNASPVRISDQIAPVSASAHRFPGGAITSDPGQVDRLAKEMGSGFPQRPPRQPDKTIARVVGEGQKGPGNPVYPRSSAKGSSPTPLL